MSLSDIRKRTREELRIRRELGQTRRPKKRLPRQSVPKGLERAYAKVLRKMVRDIRPFIEDLLRELPALTKSARDEKERLDAGEPKRISELIELAAERLQIDVSAAENLAQRFAQDVADHQKREMARTIRAGLGVDIFVRDPALGAIMESFVAENVVLIKDIPRKTLAEIEGVVQRGVTSGALHKDIAKEISARLKIADNRAKLIARDQVGKFYGNVQRSRQKSLGVDSFIWRTAGDERVRDEHEVLNGRKFKWSDPPGEGIPGEPINCRCYAEPVLDDLL